MVVKHTIGANQGQSKPLKKRDRLRAPLHRIRRGLPTVARSGLVPLASSGFHESAVSWTPESALDPAHRNIVSSTVVVAPVRVDIRT
jgi:hypothetical protein